MYLEGQKVWYQGMASKDRKRRARIIHRGSDGGWYTIAVGDTVIPVVPFNVLSARFNHWDRVKHYFSLRQRGLDRKTAFSFASSLGK